MKTKSIMRPVLLDIARSQDLDLLETPERLKAGPNRWEELRYERKAYGGSFDYRIIDGDVFMPPCQASQEWIMSKVTEDQHWILDLDGFFGVAVTQLDRILEAAERDGLINEADYTANMENDALATQWEDW